MHQEEYSWYISESGGAVIDRYLKSGWHSAMVRLKEIVVPAALDGCPVTGIARSAFYDARAERILLPETIEKIGVSAFESCHDLEEMVIPDGVVHIEQEAFAFCRNMERIMLPAKLRRIGEEAFRYCTSLEEIVIPEGTESIDSGAFAGCEELRKAYLPESIVFIAPDAFRGCSRLTVVTKSEYARQYAQEQGLMLMSGIEQDFHYGVLPDGTAKILKYDGDAERLVIPAMLHGHAVKVIEEHTAENQPIKTIALKEGIEVIKGYAFLRCEQITCVRIPGSVREIFPGAFAGCTGITRFEVSEDNPYFEAEGGALYRKGKKTLIAYPGARGNIALREGLEEIGDAAFALCKGLSGVKFPQRLKYIGVYAFNWCDLEEIDLPSSLETIGSFAFHQCSRMKQAHIPQGVSQGIEVFCGCYDAKITTYAIVKV